MSNYRVVIERKRTEVVVIEVNASSEGGAETQALAKAQNPNEVLDWDLDDEDFDIRETTNEDTTEDLDEEDEDEEEYEEENFDDED